MVTVRLIYPSLPADGRRTFYNHYIELTQRRALAPWLTRTVAGAKTALDLGCGVGRWTVPLAQRGYDVTGVDLSPSMIEQARARFCAKKLRSTLVVGDATTLSLDRRFELILCVTVLQHILEPSQARAAIARLATHLAPHGELVLLEAAPFRATERCNSAVFRARTLEWYRETLEQAGLRLTAQRGVDPMPLKTWLLPYYRRLPPFIARAALALITAISLPLDWMLGPYLADYSWHKVLVARHMEDAA